MGYATNEGLLAKRIKELEEREQKYIAAAKSQRVLERRIEELEAENARLQNLLRIERESLTRALGRALEEG